MLILGQPPGCQQRINLYGHVNAAMACQTVVKRKSGILFDSLRQRADQNLLGTARRWLQRVFRVWLSS